MKEVKGVKRSYACLAGWKLKAKTFSLVYKEVKEVKGVKRSYACLAGWELKANTFSLVYKEVKEVKGVKRSYACLAGWELKANTSSCILSLKLLAYNSFLLPVTPFYSFTYLYIQNYWPVTPYNSL